MMTASQSVSRPRYDTLIKANGNQYKLDELVEQDRAAAFFAVTRYVAKEGCLLPGS